jgi:phosphatidylinositol alpha-1,6-mannosyltransferase
MLNNEFPPLGGGTGTANLAMLQFFARLPGHEIDLITSALGKRGEAESFTEQINIYKVPVNNKNIHHSSNRELVTYALRGLFLALKLKRQRKYDLCFAWSTVPAGAIALLLRKAFGLRYLVRVVGPDIPGFEQRYQLISSILSPLINSVWRNAAAVVAKSAGEREMIQARMGKLEVALIPNGVDLNIFQPGDTIPDDGPLRLLCVGRLIERKGQDQLITAVKQLTAAGVNVTLDLIGTGDARAGYERHTENLGLREKIGFLGYVPRQQIATHYAKAHVFVLPSYNEGMSIATLEAMAAGLPIVTTKAPGMRELVEENLNGFTFPWNDVDTLAIHLKRLACDRALARRMGIASRARAANFSWTTAGDRYVELFRDMTSYPSNPRLERETIS